MFATEMKIWQQCSIFQPEFVVPISHTGIIKLWLHCKYGTSLRTMPQPRWSQHKLYFPLANGAPNNPKQHIYLLKLFISGHNALLEEHAIILIEFIKLCCILGWLIMEKSQNSICQHRSQFPAHPSI
jgi:hypothetical protein